MINDLISLYRIKIYKIIKQMKKISTLILFSLVAFWFTFASELLIEPSFSESRFPPADKLHAGCTNEIWLSIVADQKDINAFRIILNYNPKDIQILRVVGTPSFQNAINSTIEYDKIVINYIDSSTIAMGKNDLLKIYIKSTWAISQTNFTIASWSYTVNQKWVKIDLNWTQNISFAKVPECEPDIVPPEISLSSPENTKQRIALDSFFIFDIQDAGKWVDRNKLTVQFWDKVYLPINENLVVKDWKVYFYPEDRLGIDQKVEIRITAKDKQEYWWANVMEKKFSFKTATWMLLQSNINPNTLRKLYELWQKIIWTPSECMVLQNIEKNIWNQYKQYIQNAFGKLSCQSNIWSGNFLSWNILESWQKTKKSDSISLLWAIWRTLFFITFLLKLHYIVEYKKHKKIVKQMKKD